MEQALNILATGLTVVFLTLVLLTILVKLIGKLVIMLEKTSLTRKQKKEEIRISGLKKNILKPTPASIKPEKFQVDDEVVAAISAAVMMLMSQDGSKKAYTIRSIKPVILKGRSEWELAGIIQNTRPLF